MEVYIAVIIFIILDVVTGVIKGLKNGTLNSSILRIGLWHKTAEILAVACAGVIEYYKNFIGLSEIVILAPVAIYIALMEIVSCIENLCEINPALKKFFSAYLAKLDKNESEDNKK